MWLNVCSNCFLGSGFILQWKGVHFSDGSLFLVRGTCFNGSFKKIHEAEWVGAAPHAPLHYGKPRGIQGAWPEFILIDLTEFSLN